MKDPAFMFYSKNWIEGTADLFPEEKGVYIDLLCHQHQRGSLPNDTRRLARLVGLSQDEFEKIWKNISCKFIANGEAIANQTLKRVMEERADKGENNAIIGTFAQISKKSAATFQQKEIIKKQFYFKQFKGIEREKLSERLTEWYSERYASLVDVNVNVDVTEDVNTDENTFLKKSEKTFLNGKEKRHRYQDGIEKAFIDVFSEAFKIDYVQSKFDPDNFRSIAYQVQQVLQNKAIPANADTMQQFAKAIFAVALQDKWLKNNFTAGNIEKQINKLINLAKNEHDTRNFVPSWHRTDQEG